MENIGVLIPLMGIIWPFLALIVFLYLHYSSRNKINMALIESGRDASIFYRPERRYNSLKWGIVSIMAGLGILAGALLHRLGLPEDTAYFAPILIFVGVGLVGFYQYVSKKGVQQAQDQSDHSSGMV